ncbi:MAG: DUF502 domain-containing protein [Thermodesulfobacteriota bacterium]|nr:DUF502 domain-containing protein [Thermodesulfobacteriota bacterium]
MFLSVFKRIKTYLVTGALVMVPLFITIYVLYAIIWIVAKNVGMNHGLFAGIIGIIIALGLVLLAGFLTQHAIGGRITGWMGSIFQKIPIAGPIYSATKQIIEALMLKKNMAFQRAVLIEYPRKGIYAVVFMTKQGHLSPLVEKAENMVHVFLPTTPNPTSGFFLILPESDIVPLDISVEEAFKLIISGGILMQDNNKPIQEEQSNEY